MSLIIDFDKIYRDSASHESAAIVLDWAIELVKVTQVALLRSDVRGEDAVELKFAASSALEIAYALAMQAAEGFEKSTAAARYAKRAQEAKQAAEDAA